jgi:hypothetical protein
MSLLCSSAMVALVMAAGFVDVRSGVDCPSTDEISSSLRPLLPGGTVPGPGGDVASIVSAEARADGVAGLRLQLLRPDGTVAGERRFAAEGDCETMAEEIATVIAAWEVDPQTSVVLEESGEGAASHVAEPIVAGSRPEPPGPSFGIALGASVGAALIGGVSATGSVEAIAGPVTSWWQLRLAGMAETARERSLEGSKVSWQHTTASAGVMVRSRGPSWRFAVDAGPVLGWVTLAGRGSSTWAGLQNRVFEYGGGGALRIERTLGRVSLWLEWRTSVWTNGQQATVVLTDSDQPFATLSRFDMMVSLGGSARVLP